MLAVFGLTLPLFVLTLRLAQPVPATPMRSVLFSSASPGGGGAVGGASSPIALGKSTYGSSCALCHGAEGNGVPMLGKPLRNSEFVQSETDAQLLTLLIEGRQVDDPLNTSGALMPPRGAQGIDDEKLTAVVAYLRAIQDTGAPFASVEAWDVKGGTAQSAAVELTDNPGYDIYVASCAACHGQGAEGIEELGLPLSTSGFVRGLSEKDFVTFVKMGRSSWDENNTTGLDMPPKGGNPAINDEQLKAIYGYLMEVQKQVMGS
jgi:disulfide bond formation protein DsbB